MSRSIPSPRLKVILAVLLLVVVLYLFVSSPQLASTSAGARTAQEVHGRNGEKGPKLTLKDRVEFTHYYIALNFFNNEDVLPSFTKNLVQLLTEEILPYYPSESIVFSIFENGSKDKTPELVKTVLLPQLWKLGIGLSVQVNGSCCGGHKAKPETMDRIQWMACVRNAALEPLFTYGRTVFSRLSQYPGEEEAHLARHRIGNNDDVGNDEAGAKDRRRMPQDLDHKGHVQPDEEAGLVGLQDKIERAIAGKDVKPRGGDDEDVNRQHRDYGEEEDRGEVGVAGGRRRQGDGGGSVVLPTSNSAIGVLFFNDIFFDPSQLVELIATNGGVFDMACPLDFYYNFYDTWVARDMNGRPFSPYYPFAVFEPTVKAFERGEPSLVKCCWNGVAVINARVLLSVGVRGNRAGGGEAGNVWGPAPGNDELEVDQEAVDAGVPTNALQRQRGPGSTPFQGIQFRANTSETTCYASECQLFCEDLHAAGFDQIYVNPNVRVAYEEKFFHMHLHPTLWQRFILWLTTFQYSDGEAESAGVERSLQGLECVVPSRTKTREITLWDIVVLMAVLGIIYTAVKCIFDRGFRLALGNRLPLGLGRVLVRPRSPVRSRAA